jgi:hypothetical protein
VDKADTVPTAAVMQVPPWLWSADPSGFFDEAKIHGQLIEGAEGCWRVWTDERWRHTPSRLVTTDHLAGVAEVGEYGQHTARR